MNYEETRRRHVAHLASILPGQVDRLTWPAEKLARERERRLRALLRVSLDRSPWHRQRLRGIDPGSFREEHLDRLPTMTKDELMRNWDDIVTDSRLTLDCVQRHVAALDADAYLLGELHAVASGGSSGQRGVFVFGWEPWGLAYAGLTRMHLWDRAATPELARRPNTMAVVAAHNATHMTSALPRTFPLAPRAEEVRP